MANIRESCDHSPEYMGVCIVACAMTTPAENWPQFSGLSYATLLDTINCNSELSDHDYDSDIQCEEDEEQLAQDEERGESNSEREMNIESLNSAVRLLDVLRAPRPSDLARKRKVQCNPGKRRKVKPSSSKSEPKGVKTQDRLRKYPNDCLSVANGKLFCSKCREQLSLKSSSLTNDLKSQNTKRIRNDYREILPSS